MTFFQNPFAEDFEGNWVLADRAQIPKFVVGCNKGRGQEVASSFATFPVDLSGNDSAGASSATLNISFSMNNTNSWVDLAIDVTSTASSTAAVTAQEIASALRADGTFSSYFTVAVETSSQFPEGNVKITQKKQITQFKFYVKNGQAEESILFNFKGGVAEIPSYFDRHTIANILNFEDCVGMLIALDPSNAVDAAVINNAVDFRGNSLGLDSTTVKEDYELLEGRSGLFMFQKSTVDGSGRVTEAIEYQAGAAVGDLAKKTKYTYTGSNTAPDQMTQEPYVLTSSDLVTP